MSCRTAGGLSQCSFCSAAVQLRPLGHRLICAMLFIKQEPVACYKAPAIHISPGNPFLQMLGKIGLQRGLKRRLAPDDQQAPHTLLKFTYITGPGGIATGLIDDLTVQSGGRVRCGLPQYTGDGVA